MTDQSSSIVSTAAGRRWALGVGIGAMVFAMAVITLTMLYGKDGNSLHASGLAWAFSVVLVVLTGLGFGSAIEAVSKLKK